MEEMENKILHLQQQNKSKFVIQLMTDKSDPLSLHQDGTPQTYFDQVNQIHAHLKDIAAPSISNQKGFIPQHIPDQHTYDNITQTQVHHIHDILKHIENADDIAYSEAYVNKTFYHKL